jgi:hypothetical protein
MVRSRVRDRTLRQKTFVKTCTPVVACVKFSTDNTFAATVRQKADLKRFPPIKQNALKSRLN